MGSGDNRVEWRIKMEDGSSERAGKDSFRNMWGAISGLGFKVCDFVKKAWQVGVNDPRKFIHCLKVGIALTIVSLFYYMKPLYDGFGGNAMWAVMTVVVVLEYTTGATLYKSINRITGTSLAGFLAIGVHWVASKAGDQFEPYIVGVSIFILASAATFSRFIPTIKARFDYGAMIFILTFSLVSVSGYRIDKLLDLARERLSTVIIGTCLCIIVSMIIRPVWAGQELYVLTTGNLDKLANSLHGCVAQYFSSSEDSDKEFDKKLLGYKCVLSSKATEDSMANFARWEPAHGRFNFRHPWKQYLKIGASMRSCASVIDALIGCINSENKAHNDIKKHISSISLKVGANSVSVIRELANTIRDMKKSSKVGILVAEMNSAAQELQGVLKSYPNLVITTTPPSSSQNNAPGTELTEAASSAELAPKILDISLMDVMQVVTVASLLIEIVARVEGIVSCAEELSDIAQFKCIKSNKQDIGDNKSSLNEQKDDEGDMKKTLQMV